MFAQESVFIECTDTWVVKVIMAKNGDLSVDKGKNYKLYNELCNLSKYYYATKKGLTKQNYTKYTKKQTDTQ